MAGPLRKADLFDLDVVDAYELRSDGLATNPANIYLTTTGITTTSGTQTVVSSLGPDGEGLRTSNDHPVQAGDFLYITGSTGADGKYTVATIPDDTSVTVVEAIPTSTGGTLTWVYPIGARKVGYDYTGRIHITHNEVSGALTDLDNAIGSSSISTLSVVLPPKYDEITGTVTGLSGTPAHVIGTAVYEIATVQSGMDYLFKATGFIANGFNWSLNVLGDEYWPGPGSVTIEVHYVWSAT